MRSPFLLRNHWLLLIALAGMLSASCAKGYPGEVEEPEDAEPELIPTDIEVIGVLDEYPAGTIVRGECLVFDQFGDPMEAGAGHTPRVVIQPTHLFDLSGRTNRAARVGTGEATCSLAAYGLYSPPKNFNIVAGAPHQTVAIAEKERIQAGEQVTATCHVFDAYGNEVEAVEGMELHASPQNAGNQIDELSFHATRADLYNLRCELPGLAVAEHDVVRVDPNLPHSMTVGLRPQRSSYRQADHTILSTDVRDRYGNQITGARIDFNSMGAGTSMQGPRFTFQEDGYVTLTATVTSPIDEEVSEVTASIDVLVNSGGPGIRCMDAGGSSFNDAFFAHATNNFAPRELSVEVFDDFDIQGVRINGVPAVNSHGDVWRGNVTPHWGHNFVQVTATDEHGAENTHYCFMLASHHWGNVQQMIPGVVSLSLGERSLNNSSSSELDNLTNIVNRLVNSDALKNQLETLLRDASPFADGWWGSIIYRNNTLAFNVAATLRAHNANGVEGLELEVVLRNVSIGGGYRSRLYNPNFSVSIGKAEILGRFRISVDDGNLRVVLADTRVDLERARINISGVLGSIVSAIANAVIWLFNGLIEDLLADVVQDELGPFLSEMVESLDIHQLLPELEIPRLDADTRPPSESSVTLIFDKAFSHFTAVHRARATFGLGTGIRPKSVDTVRDTLGVPMRNTNTFWNQPAQDARPMALAVNEAFVNQVLHSLWLAGFFDIYMELGDGGFVHIDAKLPPTVRMFQGQLQVALGGVDAQLAIPPILGDPPFSIQFGGVIGASASVQNNYLVVGDLTMNPQTDLALTFHDSVDAAAQEVIENVIGDILMNVLQSTLNDALPELPIPEFEIPDDFVSYFYPALGRVTLLNSALGFDGEHLLLRGKLGVQ